MDELEQFEQDNKMEMRVRSLVGIERAYRDYPREDAQKERLKLQYEGALRAFLREVERIDALDIEDVEEKAYWMKRVEKVRLSKKYGGVR